MKHLFVFIYLTYIVSLNNETVGYRILGLFPFQGKSHFVMFEALMKGLAERGHVVDVLSHFPQKNPIPRYNDISVLGTLPIFRNNMSLDIAQSISGLNVVKFIINECGRKVCDAMLNSTVVTELLKPKIKYDLVVTEIFGTDCLLSIAYKLGVPTVGMISAITFPWSNDRFGNVDNPSYINNNLFPFTSRMSLYERIINTVVLVWSKLSYYYGSTLYSDQILHEKFGSDIPLTYEMENNMSLMLVNSHFSMDQPRPFSPNVIEVAGLHISKPKNLPLNIEKLMNNSKNGVILLTMGSMIQTETFSVDKQRGLIEAFGELPYTVLWKANRNKLPGPIPDNIHFFTWLPQMEVLCHPNLKLFITHGGLMGTQEAVYCGVPMIGIPFFGDQGFNVKNYGLKGIAVQLAYNDITKENVLSAIKTVLDDESYTKKVKELSILFRDRPMSAMDTAIYWIEYVIRHGGAQHLRPSSVYLSWYQLYLLDVFSSIVAIIVIILIIIYLIIYYVYKRFIVNFKLKFKTE